MKPLRLKSRLGGLYLDLPRAEHPDYETYEAYRFDAWHSQRQARDWEHLIQDPEYANDMPWPDDDADFIDGAIGDVIDFEDAAIRVLITPGASLAELRRLWPKLRDYVDDMLGIDKRKRLGRARRKIIPRNSRNI